MEVHPLSNTLDMELWFKKSVVAQGMISRFCDQSISTCVNRHHHVLNHEIFMNTSVSSIQGGHLGWTLVSLV